jgi:hypothetical protein
MRYIYWSEAEGQMRKLMKYLWVKYKCVPGDVLAFPGGINYIFDLPEGE